MFPHQVIAADETLSSEPSLVVVSIQLENDEPPIISNTPTSQTFVEEGGAISLFDPTVRIADADNCYDQILVEEVRVTLENPVEGEDQLLVNGSALSGYSTTFNCSSEQLDPLEEMECYEDATNCSAIFMCYEDFLLQLEYNNTNSEPGSFRMDRNFLVEVCARDPCPIEVVMVKVESW